MLKKEIFGDTELEEDGISSLVSLTQQVFIELERELKLAGFWESILARNKLRADIQKTLLQREFSKLPGLVQNRARIIGRVMEIGGSAVDSMKSLSRDLLDIWQLPSFIKQTLVRLTKPRRK